MPLQDANPTPSFGGFGLKRTESLSFDNLCTSSCSSNLCYMGRFPRNKLTSIISLLQYLCQVSIYGHYRYYCVVVRYMLQYRQLERVRRAQGLDSQGQGRS